MQISMSDYSLMPHEHFFSYIITIIQSSQFVTSFVVPVKMIIFVTSFVVPVKIIIFVQFSHVGFILEKKNKKTCYYIIFLNN